MYIVRLKPGKEKKIINGFPWIYANEVNNISGKAPQGSICRVVAFDNSFVALGYINHASKIIVRILSFLDEVINEAFFKERLIKSNQARIEMGYLDNYRVVFSESDMLPGLIVDKYADYLSVQFLTLGMELQKELIIKELISLFQPIGIYERSDVSIREKEGLKESKGVIYGEVPEKVIIEENGIRIAVDIANGQKTGYFLDQKANRDNIKYYCNGKDVLDCFCNVGGFSLCASKYHAKSVTAVDISERAIASVIENAELNGFKNITPIVADVFEQLRLYKKSKKAFDCIVLDPPAFTKSVDTVKEAYNGYVDINSLALKLLNPGGYLITCSCSQHLTLALFTKMIEESVIRSKVKAKIVELRFQGKDHANLITLPESLYLKVAVLKVI